MDQIYPAARAMTAWATDKVTIVLMHLLVRRDRSFGVLGGESS
jgi:hypothetical protein